MKPYLFINLYFRILKRIVSSLKQIINSQSHNIHKANKLLFFIRNHIKQIFKFTIFIFQNNNHLKIHSNTDLFSCDIQNPHCIV